MPESGEQRLYQLLPMASLVRPHLLMVLLRTIQPAPTVPKLRLASRTLKKIITMVPIVPAVQRLHSLRTRMQRNKILRLPPEARPKHHSSPRPDLPRLQVLKMPNLLSHQRSKSSCRRSEYLVSYPVSDHTRTASSKEPCSAQNSSRCPLLPLGYIGSESSPGAPSVIRMEVQEVIIAIE